MLDHAIETAFVAFIKTDLALVGVHFFTGHEDEEHQLPAVTVTSKSESLAGSAAVFRTDITLIIESEAHDSEPDEHAALVEKIRVALANKAAVVVAINTGNAVHLYGYAFTASSLDVDGKRFRTSLTFKAGYGVL